MRKNLIEPEELAALIANQTAGVSIVDASWYLPAQNRNAKDEFAAKRIPGAQYFDIDLIADHESGLPHTLPQELDFKVAVEALGISDRDHIIVYDGPGIFSAARAWFMFKFYGAKSVQVLSGGFDHWQKLGLPVENGENSQTKTAVFNVQCLEQKTISFDDVLKNINSKDFQVLDARARDRFSGSAPEPRTGVQSGHIPGSSSLPFTELLENGTLKQDAELEAILTELSIDQNTPVITSCGSGVTACVLLLALDEIGHKNTRLYDGSWSEWGTRNGAPIETGLG